MKIKKNVTQSLWASFSCLKSSCLDSKSGFAADPGGAFGLLRLNFVTFSIFLTFDIKIILKYGHTPYRPILFIYYSYCTKILLKAY